MTNRDADADPITAAGRLIGSPVDRLEPVGGGRNSRVYRVSAGRDTFALKRYPSHSTDPRDRLGTEAEALALMQAHGFRNVPEILASDSDGGYALLSWLEGRPVPKVDRDGDIDEAIAFLAACHGMRTGLKSTFNRHAAEACLSGTETETQIGGRLAALRGAMKSDPDLSDFLETRFSAALDLALAQAKSAMALARLDFNAALPRAEQTLAPADFGFHNSLRRPDGTLAFFDFEYFGWDDPVKLTADVLYHPGTPVAGAQRARFRRAALDLYGDSPTFAARLNALHPLFGLRWVLILLNEFLPERWQLRVSAGETESWDHAKARQLAKAQAMLARVASADREMRHG